MTDPLSLNSLLMTGMLSLLVSFSFSMLGLGGGMLVATAITLYGPESGAALATVVGVLVEVPVMLSVVAFCNRTRAWFPQVKMENKTR